MKNYAITIGRQLGSGGKLLGKLLSQCLGIPCYDKELIQIASQESGVGKEFFEKMDEKSSYTFFSNYFGFRSGFMEYNEGNYLCNETLFKIQSDVIRGLAEKESGIFIGRCADYILRDNPQCLKIFVCATLSDRVSRVMEENGLSEKKAKAKIELIDKKRAAYYNYYSNKTWGMSMSYDLCINSSVLGLEDAARFIEEEVKKKFV